MKRARHAQPPRPDTANPATARSGQRERAARDSEGRPLPRGIFTSRD